MRNQTESQTITAEPERNNTTTRITDFNIKLSNIMNFIKQLNETKDFQPQIRLSKHRNGT